MRTKNPNFTVILNGVSVSRSEAHTQSKSLPRARRGDLIPACTAHVPVKEFSARLFALPPHSFLEPKAARSVKAASLDQPAP